MRKCRNRIRKLILSFSVILVIIFIYAGVEIWDIQALLERGILYRKKNLFFPCLVFLYNIISSYIFVQYNFTCALNSLQNNEFFDWSKFKAIADDNLIVNQKLKFALGKVENIVEKGNNAGYQHFFSFSHNVFKSQFFVSVIKSRDCLAAGRKMNFKTG